MWDYEGWDFLNEEVDPEEELSWKKPITKKSKDFKNKKANGEKKKSKKEKS